MSLSSPGRCRTFIRSSPEAVGARSGVSVTSLACIVAQSFRATTTREKSSRTADKEYRPHPVTSRQVKSVCRSRLGAVVLSVNSSAASATSVRPGW